MLVNKMKTSEKGFQQKYKMKSVRNMNAFRETYWSKAKVWPCAVFDFKCHSCCLARFYLYQFVVPRGSYSRVLVRWKFAISDLDVIGTRAVSKHGAEFNIHQLLTFYTWETFGNRNQWITLKFKEFRIYQTPTSCAEKFELRSYA